ncbi:MAG: type II toxin-antitoxin system HicA family toxin [Saprospiraceae bacterium]|nr:type II toxin-antitoxin system HicA family toxin [Saprospiraceae bacterium]
MKPRKSKELRRALESKGFELNPNKGNHHEFYYLVVDGMKTDIYTYLSHGAKEYGVSLMSKIKRSLCFPSSNLAEDFFDCPMSGEDYVVLLREIGELE